jgi:hypothetical protein
MSPEAFEVIADGESLPEVPTLWIRVETGAVISVKVFCDRGLDGLAVYAIPYPNFAVAKGGPDLSL